MDIINLNNLSSIAWSEKAKQIQSLPLGEREKSLAELLGIVLL